MAIRAMSSSRAPMETYTGTSAATAAFGPSGFTVLTLLGGACVYDIGPPVVHLAAGTDGLLYAGSGRRFTL
jgi:hypothetical protein